MSHSNFPFSFVGGRQHGAVCSLLWYFREKLHFELRIQVHACYPQLPKPNKDNFVEEISDPGLVSKGMYERSPVPLEGTQSPHLYTSSCLSPVLEQDLTRLWHPSPGLPASSTHARGALQSQVTVFVRRKVEQTSACQLHNQILFL